MKTLKAIILGVIAVMTVGAASAKSVNAGYEKISVNYALTTYVNALSFGKNTGLSEVLDQDFKFSMLRNNSLKSYNKEQTVNFLSDNEDVQQDCKTTVTISESNADITVAKVSMKYATFTRVNYITLTSGSEGWKITNVYSVFK